MAEPWTPEEITPDWLTGVLRRAGVLEAGRVVGCEPVPLHGSPSFTGSFCRLLLRYDGPAPGAPRSLVVKASTEDAGTRESVSAMGFYARETAFYRSCGAAAPVSVPNYYYGAVSEEGGHSLLLLEDLSAARQGRSSDACTAADAALAVDTMADLHASWWGSAKLAGDPLLDVDSFATSEQLAGMFTAFWPAFCEKRSAPLTDAHVAAAELIDAEVAAAIEELFHQPPFTLVHHDFQGDNLLFDVGGRAGAMAVLDWQMAVRGRPGIDLAYFLSGSLDTADRRRDEEALVRRYADRLAASGVSGYTVDEAWSDYRRALVLPPSRLAIAVAATSHMQAHAGAFWDVLFDRQVQALRDHDLV